MLKKMPWLSSRKNFLILCSFDLFIINYFYIIIKIKNHGSTDILFINIFAFFWILTSYTLDKYSSDIGEEKQFKFSRNLFRICKISIISGFSLKIIENIFFSSNNLLTNPKWISFLGFITLISFIFEILYSIFIRKYISTPLNWVSIYSSKTEESIFSKNINFYKYNYLKSIHISQINKINIKDISFIGLIIEDINSLNNIEKMELLNLKNKGFKIISLSNWLEKYLNRYPPEYVDSQNILSELLIYKQSKTDFRFKRFSEFILSLLLLIFTSPLILVASICIKLEDGGPIFYSQKRNGFGGQEFTIYKLRSMKTNAEKGSIKWSTYNDDRITRVGAFLRKARIDELPQLLAVIKGDMSLIGPRPERPEIDAFLVKEIPNYKFRYLVRPGLSGWAQVNYPYGASIGDTKIKFSYDIYYIKNFSTFFDLLILLETIRLVFNFRGSQPNNINEN